MAEANLGSLIAKLGLDVSSLKNTVGEAKQQFVRLKVDGEQAAGGLGGSFVKAGAIAAAAIGAIGLAAGAFALKSADSFRKVAGEVNELRRFTGGTAEEMSKLRFAAQQSGVDTEKLAKTLEVLSLKIAAGGSGLEKFGIATTDSSGKMRPLKDVLYDTADVFKSMPDGIRKTQIAQEAFGKSGDDLIPMLNKGRAGLEGLGAAAQKYGLVLTSQNIDAAKKATVASREQAAAMQGLQLQIGAHVIPAVTELTKELTQGLVAVMPAVSAVIRGAVIPALEGFTKVISGTIGFLTENVGAAQALGSVLATVLVPALTAWAVAQARAVAVSIGAFLTEGALGAVKLANALGLVTVSARSGAVGLTAMNLATAGVFAGVGVAVAMIIADNQKIAASAKVANDAIVAGAKSPQDAIDQLRVKQAALRKEGDMGSFAARNFGVYFGDTAKKVANARAGYKDATDQIKELQKAQQAGGAAATEAEVGLIKEQAALATVSSETGRTESQVRELAKAMKIDLAKSTEDSTAALVEQSERLKFTSASALGLSDANKVLSDWTKDATQKTAAFSAVLDQTIGTKMRSAQADRAYQDAQTNLSKHGTDWAKKQADANRTVRDTIRGLTSATEARQAAEERLQEILNPKARTLEDANLGLQEARLAKDRADKNLTEAERTRRLAGRRGSRAVAEADLDLRDARLAQQRATQGVADAEKKVFDLTPEGIRQTKDYKDATKDLAGAKQDEADALDATAVAIQAAKDIENDHIGRQNDLAARTDAVATAVMAQAIAIYAATGSMNAAKGPLEGHTSRLNGMAEALAAINAQLATGPQSASTSAAVRAVTAAAGIASNAAGSVVRQPTLSWLAEEGPEVVLPLANPARMRQLIAEAGIGGMFNGGYQPGQGAPTIGRGGPGASAPARPNVSLTLNGLHDQSILQQATHAADVIGWRLASTGRP